VTNGLDKVPVVLVIKDIRRATRRQFTAEEKVRIVLESPRVESSVAEIGRREGIESLMCYGWLRKLLQAGKRRLARDTTRAATPREVNDVRREAQGLKKVGADPALESRMQKT